MVFVDSLTSYPSQKAERYHVIKEIKQQLEAYQRLVAEQDLEVTFEISKWEAPRVLSFSLKSRHLHGPVDIDVLPAFNALGETPRLRSRRRKGLEWWWERVERKPPDSGMGHGAGPPQVA